MRSLTPIVIGLLLVSATALAACSGLDPNPPHPGTTVDPVPPTPHGQPDPERIVADDGGADGASDAGL